jgi:hypothetical protein
MIAKCDCGAQFEVPVAAPDIVNGRYISVLVLSHHVPTVCETCGAEYVPTISTASAITLDLMELPKSREVFTPKLVLAPN